MAENKKPLDAYYGEPFPGFSLKRSAKGEFSEKAGEKWREWLDKKWEQQQHTMRSKRLHWARHRHFRQGRQWISSRDGRTWKEPRHDENTIRQVINLIGPALDYRLGVLREQRPGFRYEALGSTVEAKEQAQAQQITVEYYFHTLQAWLVVQDALQAAQTDGVAFIHVFKDKALGKKQQRVSVIAPDDERFKLLEALGHKVREDGNLEIPLDAAGEAQDAGTTASEFSEGDLAQRVVYAYETVADPESKTINGPYDKCKWLIIRRIRDLKSARAEVGDPDLAEEVADRDTDPLDQSPRDQTISRGLPSYPTHRREKQSGVYEYLVFFNGSVVDDIPDGAWRRIIGKKIVDGENELPGGIIPLAAIRDGSSDPDLYPRPIMSDWIGDQVALNAFVSMAIMHARVMGGGRILALKDTVIEETYSAVMGSLLEYSGQKPEFMTPPRVGGDIWSLIEFHKKTLEDKTLHNDLARGQVTGSGSFQDVSGRAVLGARELFERGLGPMVRAASDGVTEWSKLIITYAKDMFTTPRLIPVMGGRSDLAKRIGKEELGGDPLVSVDPETLMPLPRALRNQMLFEMFEKGIITLDEYKQRAPFAFIRDVYSGEQTQWSRAQVVNEVLAENWEELEQLNQQDPLAVYAPENGVVVLWSDDPEAHMNALMEVILDDRKPWGMRMLAMARFNIYEDLDKSKKSNQIIPDPNDPSKGIQSPLMPVPVEVIGAPAEIPRKEQSGQSSQQGKSGQQLGPLQQASPTPESAAVGSVAGGQEAQALGTFGAVERQLAGGEQLPR